MLRCPRCGVTSGSVDGVPVLVSFENSVLDPVATFRAGAASPVPHRSAAKGSSAHPQVAANLEQLTRLLEPASRVLIVGGGEDAHGLGGLLASPDVQALAFDIYASEMTDFVADAHNIPLIDESVDCVVIQAVLEHVLDPWRVADELYRVLRPSGLIYAETPFLQQVHEGAYDFTRFTESGHRWLFRRFELIESGAIGGPILVCAWTSSYLLRAIRVPSKVRNALRRVLVWLSRHLDMALNRRIGSDSASAVYFLGRKGRDGFSLSPAEIIAFYSRGER